MKLVVAIIQDRDTETAIEALTKRKFPVTRIATSGGFVRQGNTTLLLGVDEAQVKPIADLLREVCHRRRMFMPMASGITDTAYGLHNGERVVQYIDFAVCARNWLALNGEEVSDSADSWQRCVGEHNLCAIPPYIEFFTQPRTRFEFSFMTPCETRDELYYWLAEWVQRAGWVTLDRS